MASISARTRSTTSQTNAIIQPVIFAEPAIPIHKLTTPNNIAQLSAELIPTNVSPQQQATMHHKLIQGLHVQYIDMIQVKYLTQPVVVDRFRAMFKQFREAFKPFLPEGWQLQLNEKMDKVNITIPKYQPLYIILPTSLAPVNEPIQEDALDLSIPKGGPNNNNNKRDDEAASQLPSKKRFKQSASAANLANI